MIIVDWGSCPGCVTATTTGLLGGRESSIWSSSLPCALACSSVLKSGLRVLIYAFCRERRSLVQGVGKRCPEELPSLLLQPRSPYASPSAFPSPQLTPRSKQAREHESWNEVGDVSLEGAHTLLHGIGGMSKTCRSTKSYLSDTNGEAWNTSDTLCARMTAENDP